MTLDVPAWLAVLAVPLLAALWRRRRGPVVVSSASLLDGLPATWRVRLRPLPDVLRWLALAAVALALASPRVELPEALVQRRGVDVLLLVDVSQSMQARDAAPDRLRAVLAFSRRLIDRRPGDRFGVVLFAGANTLACPVTADHRAVVGRLAAVEPVPGEGTAFGTAILGAIKRVPANRRAVIVAFSDGVSNAGTPAPAEAAAVAASVGVPIITVAIGRTGIASFPTEFGLVDVEVEVDEAGLQAVSAASRGVFVRASDRGAVETVARRLQQAEPPPDVEMAAVTQWLTPWLTVLAAALVALELAFAAFALRRVL
jgi:Ca-activated chloride channel family protein